MGETEVILKGFGHVMCRRVLHLDVSVQFEHDKLDHNLVELEERHHNSVVHIVWKLLGKFVRLKPEDLLAINVSLVVDSLDTQEYLGKTLAHDYVGVEFSLNFEAILESFRGDFEDSVRRERSEETDKTERVVKVSDCVYKCGVSLFDDHVKRVGRLGLHE